MSILFQPVRIGQLVVKNRFVRSATHDYLGSSDGTITENELQLYETLAKNELGLIITAHSYVQSPLGRGGKLQNAIYDDRFIEGYKKLAEIVHKHGSRLIVQISHAGGLTVPKLTGEQTPVAASPVLTIEGGVIPREITEKEIREVIDAFVEAAVRIKTAGCDGVQIHCAHGYLLSGFLSPYFNRRTDKWGGNVENRTRIVREIIAGIRSAAGREFPVLVKINSTDSSGDDYIEDVLYMARLFESLGATAVELSGHNWTGAGGENYYLQQAAAVKKNTGIPVILVGGLRTFETMESLVENNTLDLVSMCRPFICEPDLVVRFRNGQKKSSCGSCNGCFNSRTAKCIRC
ncbi:MAG: NADH:flavin oxidoreductase [Peptococcaceae bacterium]|nr:NADH:flavin oxidoreductase [Peptococcaceae bacterium]MDH7523800.1 NADH:flavin oxidoreductase [Peptococcaceae bacterium]